MYPQIFNTQFRPTTFKVERGDETMLTLLHPHTRSAWLLIMFHIIILAVMIILFYTLWVFLRFNHNVILYSFTEATRLSPGIGLGFIIGYLSIFIISLRSLFKLLNFVLNWQRPMRFYSDTHHLATRWSKKSLEHATCVAVTALKHRPQSLGYVLTIFVTEGRPISLGITKEENNALETAQQLAEWLQIRMELNL